MSLAVSFSLALKGFLLRPFDERRMSETLAFSALVHALLFFASTLFAWLLPRYIEPFPSTRVEIISEAELQQRLKAYRTTAKTTPSKPLQQEQPTEEQAAEQSAPTPEKTEEKIKEKIAARVAVDATKTTPSQPSSKTKEPTATQEKVQEQEETIDDLLTSLEATSDKDATLDESLDEALTESEADPSFLTSESVLTAGELAAFRRHITQCWSPPVGAPALENLVVDLLLTLDEQAYVIDTLVMDRARMTNDPFFRSAAEAALRTLSDKACSPLRLPLNKHALWKKTILRFDPRSLLGK